MKIKNFDVLAATESRRAVLEIAEAGLEAVDTEKAIERAVELREDALIVQEEIFPLRPGGRIIVIGIGKCAIEAGRALERMLGDRIWGGIAVDVHEGELKKIRVYRGTHPLPTDANVDATRAIIELLKSSKEDDVIIFVISGGGSTLLCQPTNFTCLDEAEVLKHLTAAGATIREINTLRKHLSSARGGQLAKYAYPARSVALIFSDVPGNNLQFVASGPTVKDETTVEDAEAVMRKYGLRVECSIEDCTLIETPKEDKYFKNVRNILIVSNKTALDAMAEKARELGYEPEVVTTELSGEARVVGEEIAERLGRARPKTVLLYGGETTVKVKNPSGRGGRNQELALSAMRHLAGGQVIASVASDGRDNTEYGGAICDTITVQKAAELGLDLLKYLDQNHSYEFFSQVGGYLATGDTGSNVSDLVIALNNG